MFSNRRSFLAGLGSTVAVSGLSASPAIASASTRRFSALLGSRRVGETFVSLSRSGSRVIAEIDARLQLRIFGLINFEFHLTSREVWRDGVLQEIRSTTNNNGAEEYVNADRIAGGLNIDGSGYRGVVAGNPATTSYFTPDFLARPVWISTQNGKPLNLTIRNAGPTQFNTSEGLLDCTMYTTRGKLEQNLFYDRSYEWVGSSFLVAGREANIRMSSRGGSLNQVWAG